MGSSPIPENAADFISTADGNADSADTDATSDSSISDSPALTPPDLDPLR